MHSSEPRGPVLILVLVLLAVATFGLVSCRGQAAGDSSMAMSVEVSPSPPAVGPATVTATIKGSAGEPVSGAQVEIESNMNHAGMVPVIVDCTEKQDGVYEGRDFRFTMPGDWIITVRAEMPDGRTAEQSFPVPGVVGKSGAQPVAGTSEKGGH